MFRRVILTACLGMGLVGGLTMTPATAAAHPPIEHLGHRFEVVTLRHGCWECVGVFHDRCEAERVAHHLRHEGRMVEIRHR